MASLKEAAAFVERAGRELEWAIRDEDGIAIYAPRDAERPHRQYSHQTT